MAEREAAESRFKARAGTMALLFIAGSAPRELLLELLERARYGGILRAIFEAHETEDFEDEHYGDEGGLEEFELDSGQTIGPHTLVKTSSKGEEALYVAFALERWLRNCPDGPQEIGAPGGNSIAALVFCWSATVTHALAERPLTMAELERKVEILDRATLEEHVEAMEMTSLVEARSEGGETRYAATDWLRESIAPLAAAARMERHYPERDVAAPDVLDVEAAFQLTLPLIKLPPDLAGSCRLGVQIPGGEPLMAGATVQVEDGRVVASSTELNEDPENWATGSPIDWLETLVDPTTGRIKSGGDTRLARALLEGLHERLFGIPVL